MPRSNRYEWLAEPLMGIEGAALRSMFGCRSLYARGRLLLVLADEEEPWNGVLFPAERDQHAGILARWPMLTPHAILPKWLYLSETSDRFEFVAQEIIQEIRQGNPLFGVVPPAKKRKASTKKGAPADGRGPQKAGGDSQIPPHLRK